MKIVINKCYGGFGLSNKAFEEYLKRKGIEFITGEEKSILGENRYYDKYGNHLSDYDIDRDDPDLVAVVEELGEEANGPFAELEVAEIPDDVEWTIEEHDGFEWIAEAHRTWR